MTVLDVEFARNNMIAQQIRPWDVLNQQVIDVLSGLPREDFVPAQYRHLAFSDIALPIGHGEVMLKPNLEGRIVQALALQPTDRVLEVGTGSGHLTALLSRVAASVISVDCIAEFTQTAARILKAHQCNNVTLHTGDASKGWGTSRYDAIAITGALPAVPEVFEQSLNLGGRLFIVVGQAQAPMMEAFLITRVGRQEWVRESLLDTVLPPLRHTAQEKAFIF